MSRAKNPTDMLASRFLPRIGLSSLRRSEIFFAKNIPPNDPAHGWDGNTKGFAVNPGVVVFLAKIRMDNGETVIYSGDLTIIK